MKHYRVWLGYEKFIEVDQEDVKKCMVAKVEGATLLLPQGLIDGKYISLIEPDKHKILGVNPDWKLTGEDMRLLPAGELRSHELYLEAIIKEIKDGTIKLEDGIKRLN